MQGALTDTNALIWYSLGNAKKLGVRAQKMFEAADRRDGSCLVLIPAVVLHELSGLIISEKIELELSFADWVRKIEKHPSFAVVETTSEMVIRSHNFTGLKDPFDRLIVGCADVFEQPLITSDQSITDSHLVEVIWD